MPLKPKQRAFLGAYRKTASLTRAAAAAEIDRTSHYTWLEDQEYAAAFELAKVEAGQTLEDAAVLRACEGVLEPVFYKGAPVGAIRRYSDGLMQFLLRGIMPDKYRERAEKAEDGAGVPPLIINAYKDDDEDEK